MNKEKNTYQLSTPKTHWKNQEWRKNPPIVIKNGKVETRDRLGIPDCGILEENLIKEMKLIVKMVRGIYSGDFREDFEYLQFCQRSIKNMITERSKEFIAKNIEEISVAVGGKSKGSIALPFTTPTQLRSNPVVDEIIKIDLTKELSEEEKKDLKDAVLEKKYENPEDDPISPVCKSSDAGKSILEVLKNELPKKKDTKKRIIKKTKKKVAKKKTKKKVIKKKKVAKKKKNDRK